jgi:hypothetical protein
LLLAAFVLNLPWLVGIVALFMLAGTVMKRPGFAFIYQLLLKPAGVVKPLLVNDNAEPHRFAQGFGALVLTGATLAFLVDAGLIGWALSWLVIGLAALNLFVGYCVGCAVYYWLNKLNIPGFTKSPPEGTLPGMRPK